MICEACRDRRHGDCRGGTWCDCQHQPAENAPAPAEPAEPAEPDQIDGDEGPEPGVNWLRQG
jgi:hypothetical protein